MKALFLIYHGLDASNGISKKIHAQVDALRSHGLDIELCLPDETTGEKRWMVGKSVIANYGSGIKGKVLKRILFDAIVEYVRKEQIKIIYMRYDLNANPFTIRLIRQLHQAGAVILTEIPTYPYDNEEGAKSRRQQRKFDRRYRQKFFTYVDRVVTFSSEKTIFGRPTINISNGIDLSQIKLIEPTPKPNDDLHMICVAQIHYWHGVDRMVRGLGEYYKQCPSRKVYLDLVGQLFSERERQEVLTAIAEYNIEKYVIQHGAKHGAALDDIFDRADIALGSLGRHRSGITYIKTLKNREYAARGLAFVYSETDTDFEEMPYILKAPADESPLDIQAVIAFHEKLSMPPQEIRNSITHLTWIEQMRTVLRETPFLNPFGSSALTADVAPTPTPSPTAVTPKVSIIIPLYNTEEYIEETVRSIQEQTLREIEIIIINDGSTDRSLEIVQRIAAQDPRITVVSQTNQGQSAARNNGTTTATGDYIYYMDSDDLLKPATLADCYTFATNERLEMVCFDAEYIKTNNEHQLDVDYSRATILKDRHIYSGKEYIEAQLRKGGAIASPCLYITRRDYLRSTNLLFYRGIIHEDQLYTTQLTLRSKRLGYLAQNYFERRLRANSVMTTTFSMRNIIGYATVTRELLRFADLHPETKPIIDAHLTKMLNAVAWLGHRMAYKDRRAAYRLLTATPKQYISLRNKLLLLFKAFIKK